MTSAASRRTRVSFEWGGVRLAGYLHRPADVGGVLPCVVMGHGSSGTQDRLFELAERLAAVGLLLYRDPVRQQVVADQIDFLREHLVERTRHDAASTAAGREQA
jgi:poly(3-hydroxybutyrate) depolymerase